MEIKYQVTMDDYVEYNLIFAWRNQRKIYYACRWGIAAAILAAALWLLLRHGGDRDSLIAAATVAVAAVVYAILYTRKRWLNTMAKSVRKLAQKGTLPYSSEGTLRFEDAQVTDQGSNATLQVEYQKVEAVITGQRVICVMLGMMHGLLIPRGSLQHGEEEALMALLHEKLPQAPFETSEL